IAFLNVLMLAIAACFCILKVFDAILVFLALFVFTWVPYTQEFITPTWNFHDKFVSKAADRLEKGIEKMFPIVGRTQEVVAIAAPFWGGFTGGSVGIKYSDFSRQHWGLGGSLSMLPLDFLTRLQKARPNKMPGEPEMP